MNKNEHLPCSGCDGNKCRACINPARKPTILGWFLLAMSFVGIGFLWYKLAFYILR